jgi:hypothetical protein
VAAFDAMDLAGGDVTMIDPADPMDAEGPRDEQPPPA